MARRPLPSDRVRAWLRRARALMRRDVADRRMSAELAFHLDMETDKNIRAGMKPADARRAAVLAFGGMDRVSEEIRDVRGIVWVDDALRDLRHAARALRRSPGFAASAIAALSLGIGANTAVFAVVHAVVIAPLPYAEPDRLVRVWEANPAQGIEHALVSPGTLVDLRQRSRTLERVAIFGEREMLFTDDRQTWAARAAAVSPALFNVLSVRPTVGRVFPSEDDRTAWTGSHDDVVISYGLWQRQFGSDPAVVGRTIRMDYRWSYTIIGVMPLGFSFPTNTDVWVPLTYGPTVSPLERQFRYYGAVAQMRQGVTIDEARRETATIAAELQTELPASNAGWTIELARLDRSIVGGARPALFVLLGLATCVLLIACGNVATLAVARATARRHELAVRTALGAGRGRLIRQWAAEALLLAGLGGAGGALVGYWCNRLLLALAPHDIPRLDEVAFGTSAVAFVGLATIVVGLIIGLVPALRSRDASALDALRSRTRTGGARSARSREWLVGLQVALTCVLTVAAVLLRAPAGHRPWLSPGVVALRRASCPCRPILGITAVVPARRVLRPSHRRAESNPWCPRDWRDIECSTHGRGGIREHVAHRCTRRAWRDATDIGRRPVEGRHSARDARLLRGAWRSNPARTRIRPERPVHRAGARQPGSSTSAGRGHHQRGHGTALLAELRPVRLDDLPLR